MSTFVVTGGAGFIGSNIAEGLTRRYPNHKVMICDYFGSGDKWRNTRNHPVDEIITPGELFYWLEMHGQEVEAIIHMGAISSTTETDADRILEVNFALSKILRLWAIKEQKRFIYASSASTYGDGAEGFDDDLSLNYQSRLKPLNTYGWSKQLFDFYVARSVHRGEQQPKQWAGLKFFNVYGPNEYHKADQMSVVCKIFPHARAGRPVHLFKSYNAKYKDGGQLRDFIYVKDCVNVVLWLLDNPNVNGLFNVGTGQARSFEDLAKALFHAVGQQFRVQYDEMPDAIKDKYQYHTEAKMDRLRAAGYTQPFHSIEEGVRDYAQKYLMKDDPYI